MATTQHFEHRCFIQQDVNSYLRLHLIPGKSYHCVNDTHTFCGINAVTSFAMCRLSTYAATSAFEIYECIATAWQYDAATNFGELIKVQQFKVLKKIEYTEWNAYMQQALHSSKQFFEFDNWSGMISWHKILNNSLHKYVLNTYGNNGLIVDITINEIVEHSYSTIACEELNTIEILDYTEKLQQSNTIRHCVSTYKDDLLLTTDVNYITTNKQLVKTYEYDNYERLTSIKVDNKEGSVMWTHINWCDDFVERVCRSDMQDKPVRYNTFNYINGSLVVDTQQLYSTLIIKD